MTLEEILRKKEYRIGLLTGALIFCSLSLFTSWAFLFSVGISTGSALVVTGICYLLLLGRKGGGKGDRCS
jgi:hypothetical protein